MYGPVDFNPIVPVDDAGLNANVASTLARGFPGLSEAPRCPEHLTLVANGPTARFAPLDGPTAAVNGALKLFTAQGKAPTYAIACDPQALVADFYADAPEETVYLIASKCHPSVFDALAGRKVFVWHVDDVATWGKLQDLDPVLSGTSVTICAFEVFARLGARTFETWGWDGCFAKDRSSHAVAQQTNGQTIINEVGDREYLTTTSWALEAQSAWNRLQHVPIRINGGGMVGAIFDFQRAA